MSNFVTILVDMGFDAESAKEAVEATGNVGVERAMNWLLDKKAEQQSSSKSAATSSANGNSAAKTEDAVVRSYKCEDCGKILRNEDEMELHAAKTKHTNFSESTDEKKPLTEEQRKGQMLIIEEKLKAKRAEREAREKQEAIEKERMRMKSGKELAEYKRKFQEQEMKELAEARRREKIEDQKARERVKAQIAADRLARKAKEAGLAGQEPPLPISIPNATSSTESLSSVSSEPAMKKDYTETKLQLRLPSGKQLIQSFNAKEPLAAVRVYIQLNRDDGIATPFNLMTTFPRKIFEDSDYDKPLEVLGLVPSAVLMVTKTV